MFLLYFDLVSKLVLSFTIWMAGSELPHSNGAFSGSGDTTSGYMNPVVPGFHPDPSVCRVGEDYYLATSSFEYFPGVPIYHSRDLVNWRLIGHALHRPEQIDLTHVSVWSGIYAPTIRYHKGTFYLATTNVGGKGNFYVTSKDPAGPWSDPVWVDEHFFDPSLFFDDDGKVYYTRRSGHHVLQAEIDIETGQLLTDLVKIDSGRVSPDAEGPHLYKFNDYYYLMQAEGGTRFLHMETIGRSKSPWGPFEHFQGNPILSQRYDYNNQIKSTGHAELIQAHDGSWWMTFLATRHYWYDALSHLGRETFLTPVTWVDGWPIPDLSAVETLDMNVPTLPLNPWPPESPRDEFDGPGLELYWNHLRGKDTSAIALKQGRLVLTGNAFNLNDIAVPAFVGRRQQHFNFTGEALLEFDPQNQQEEAGLAIYLNHAHHYQFFLTKRQGETNLVVRKTIGDLRKEVYSHPLKADKVKLKITADPREYQFWWARPGSQDYASAGKALSQYVSTELASSWSGVFIAMYASGNGHQAESKARFDWFNYQPGNF
ncbi:MAG: glycoside hydrolase family 43 protein [Candidatus Cyclobacteriaceae bacterium M3_2C_046]